MFPARKRFFPILHLYAYKDSPEGVDVCILRDTNTNVNPELNEKDEPII